MQPQAIKQHIDNNISKMLETDSYDVTRSKVLKIVNSFRERITEHNLELEEILKLSDSRTRYTSLYVYYAQKRITDLYKLERRLTNINSKKAFRCLLFKERLDRRENLPFTYSPKYKSFLKKTI
jgi:hypothetical protein